MPNFISALVICCRRDGLAEGFTLRKMLHTLAILPLLLGTAEASSFDSRAAADECRHQWGKLSQLGNRCIAGLEEQSRRLESYRASMDRDRVSLAEEAACKRQFPTRYHEQMHCLEDAGRCHYRDLHGQSPIEDHCP